MKQNERIDNLRGEALNAIDQSERLFKAVVGLCGVAEIAGLAAVLWFMNWGDPTHRLVFAATMLVWINLALWVAAVAVRNRVGEQRILRAIEVLHDAMHSESTDSDTTHPATGQKE